MKNAPSYYILLTVNVLAIVIALVILGITLNIMYGKGIGIASLDGLPVDIYYVVIAFALFVFIVSLLGVLGGCLHNKAATVLFTVVDLLLAIAVLIIMVFVLLYANGISTTPTVDSSIKSVQDKLQAELLSRAINHTDIWFATEQAFGCCGIDFQETYNYGTHSLNDTDYIDLLQPGADCADTRSRIASLHLVYPTFTQEAKYAAGNDTILSKKFCKSTVSAVVKSNTTIIGAIAGVLIFLMIVTAAAAIRLLSKITTDQGGFQPPPEALGGALAHGGQPGVNPASAPPQFAQD